MNYLRNFLKSFFYQRLGFPAKMKNRFEKISHISRPFSFISHFVRSRKRRKFSFFCSKISHQSISRNKLKISRKPARISQKKCRNSLKKYCENFAIKIMRNFAKKINAKILFIKHLLK